MHWVCVSRYHKIITSLELFTFWTSRHARARFHNTNAPRCKSSEILMRETFLRARFGLYVGKNCTRPCARPANQPPNQTRPLLRGNLSTMIIISSSTRSSKIVTIRGEPRSPGDSTSLGLKKNEIWKCLIRTQDTLCCAK